MGREIPSDRRGTGMLSGHVHVRSTRHRRERSRIPDEVAHVAVAAGAHLLEQPLRGQFRVRRQARPNVVLVRIQLVEFVRFSVRFSVYVTANQSVDLRPAAPPPP